jgi:hypothetical protein
MLAAITITPKLDTNSTVAIRSLRNDGAVDFRTVVVCGFTARLPYRQ